MSAVAPLSVGHSSTLQLGPTILGMLADPGVGEIVVNRPGEARGFESGEWVTRAAPELTYKLLLSIGVSLASRTGDDFSVDKSILSTALESGERVQVVRPPTTPDGTVSITIRKPLRDDNLPVLADYRIGPVFGDGGDPAIAPSTYVDVLPAFVAAGRTFVIGGSTGSGKSTLLRVFAAFIPPTERIVTIEDTPELPFGHLDHRVSLSFRSESRDAKPGEAITPTQLIRAAMRMFPDRIVIGEARGGEALDYLAAATSGHGGGITTTHAGSAAETLDRLAFLACQHPDGRGYSLSERMHFVGRAVEVAVYITRDADGRYRIADVWGADRIRAWAADGR